MSALFTEAGIVPNATGEQPRRVEDNRNRPPLTTHEKNKLIFTKYLKDTSFAKFWAWPDFRLGAELLANDNECQQPLGRRWRPRLHMIHELRGETYSNHPHARYPVSPPTWDELTHARYRHLTERRSPGRFRARFQRSSQYRIWKRNLDYLDLEHRIVQTNHPGLRLKGIRAYLGIPHLLDDRHLRPYTIHRLVQIAPGVTVQYVNLTGRIVSAYHTEP